MHFGVLKMHFALKREDLCIYNIFVHSNEQENLSGLHMNYVLIVSRFRKIYLHLTKSSVIYKVKPQVYKVNTS